MAGGKSNRKVVARSMLLGAAGTLLVLAAHLGGLDTELERMELDAHFARTPTVEMTDRLVHVDLDDKAIEHVGRWPWPRRELAQLVRTLHQAGAAAVVLDIILPTPQPPRFVHEGVTDLYAADAEALLNEAARPVPVLDDLELAEAFADCPNLFLPMHADEVRGVAAATDAPALERLLATRPALEVAAAGAELGRPGDELAPAMGPALLAAFNRRIRALLADEPDLSQPEVARRLLGGDSGGSLQDDMLRQAYLRQRALRRMRAFALPNLPADTPTRVAPRGLLIPPLVALAEASGHSGFVSYKPQDESRLRYVPLLVAGEDGVFPHLSLNVAMFLMEQRDGRPPGLACGGEDIVLTGGGVSRRIPLDDRGRMLINWARTGPDRPRHVSALAAADVWQARDRIERNDNLRRSACIAVAQLLSGDDERAQPILACQRRANQAWQRLFEARLRLWRARLYAPAEAVPVPPELLDQERALQQQVDQAAAALLKEVDELYLPTGATSAPAASAPADEQLARLAWLRQLVRRLEAERPRLQRQQDASARRLRDVVAGKVCLVGSNTTAAADFVATPIDERMPGVVVHGHVVNTILSGRFIRATPGWAAVLLVLLCGAAATLTTSTRGPLAAAALLVGLLLGYTVVDNLAWMRWTYWLTSIAPLGAMLLPFSFITVYRQLTEQRQRRQITTIFKQYLSPAMVDLVADNPTIAGLGGQRRLLSCLFADLQGFTSISERLGAERTVTLLNRYLDGVGEIVLVRCGGTLSKYEGDGVFAFFGAPIDQPDHAARALRAALEWQAFLARFGPQAGAEGLLPEGVGLRVRIGITSGEVFVGNMGSSRKVAYTAIGNSVNLASRLEGANKFLGTSILVNRQAWQAAASEKLIGRPVGRILVVGTSEPVEVWEPLAAPEAGAASAREADLRRLADEFARGVELYAAGRFDQAAAVFEPLARSGDAASAAYLELCRQMLTAPPPNFDGVIRLSEK